MARLRYTNGLLTLSAGLLTLHLWTMWVSPHRAGIEGAESAMLPGERTAYAVGLPNAAQQRKQMVDLLKTISSQTDDLASLFSSGRARVRLEERRDGGSSQGQATRSVSPTRLVPVPDTR